MTSLCVPPELRGRVAGVLRRAASVIEVRGWFTGDFYDHAAADAGVPVSRCPVCALGAISVAALTHPDDIYSVIDEPDDDGEDDGESLWTDDELIASWAALTLADLVAPGTAAGPVTRVGGWNDNSERTEEQVTAALREAAEAVSSR